MESNVYHPQYVWYLHPFMVSNVYHLHPFMVSNVYHLYQVMTSNVNIFKLIIMGHTKTIVFNKAVIYVIMANIVVERKVCTCNHGYNGTNSSHLSHSGTSSISSGYKYHPT
jgi:hypothetical protein